MKDRIYICHTYYHAYVTFLKELKIRAEADPARKAGTATLVLSKMSYNFENLKARESESYPLSCSGGWSELSEEFRCRPV